MNQPRIVWIVLAMALQGCATMSMLPEDASRVDFDGTEGKTGWSQYQQVEVFRGYDARQVYSAAKAGLGDAGFALRRADFDRGVLIGEHGMTLHDWNVMAGVYWQQSESDTTVRVIVEGSKDVGFSGDVTSDGWTGKILKGMRQYLKDVYGVEGRR